MLMSYYVLTVAPVVAVMPAFGVANNDIDGIMTTLWFQCISHYSLLILILRRKNVIIA